MKKIIFLICFILIAASFASAQGNSANRVIFNHFSARDYLTTPVSQANIDQIILAAVNSPSARNRQPWHFTIVTNLDLAKRIIPQTTQGNVLFVISALGDSRTNHVEILDCALATQTIYLAAQALGLGSRIYTAPVDAVNRDLKTELGLPAGHSVIAIVRVGNIQSVDAVSAASARRAASEMVTYRR